MGLSIVEAAEMVVILKGLTTSLPLLLASC